MRLRSLILAVVVGIAAASRADAPYVPGQVLIKVTPTKTSIVSQAYSRLGFKMTASMPQTGWQVLKTPNGMTVTTAMTKLKAISGVLNATPDRVCQAADLSVSDPMVPSQYSLTKMKVPAAWDTTTGDVNVVVAVLDTGVDYTHPDLKNKIIKGRDFIQGDDDPMDVQGHGTHCAGIVAAETNNGIGVAGVGYNTNVLAVRVLGDNGSGSFSGMAQGIIWAADHGANIISMSIQAPGVKSDAACDEAIAYAVDKKNVVVFACAGNYGHAGNPPSYPAYNPRTIAVGASDANDQRAYFSMYNNGIDNWVDIAAPGVDILSTVMGPGYANMSGTSMACPNAAGVASLVWAAFLDAGITPTNTEIRTIIEGTCDSIGTWINKGRVNAYAAVLEAPVPNPDVPLADDIAPMDGTLVNVTSDRIYSVDGVSGTLKAIKKPGVGLTGSVTTSFSMTQFTQDELRSGTLTMTLKGDRLATFQVYVKNAAGDWKLAITQAVTGSTQTLTYKLDKAKLLTMMDSNNKVEFLVRSLLPTRLINGAKGATQIDQIRMSFNGKKTVATP